jgi:ribosomal protein S18 acetylase RimI-like enzyme
MFVARTGCMMTINYRVAATTDLTILLELVKEFHENEHLAFDEQTEHSVLADFLSDESLGKVWLIQQESEIIGYIILTRGYSIEYRGRDAFIDEFYLRAKYRQQGIGTKTLAFAEDSCRALGVQALHLEVDFDNGNAQRLYRRVGYQGNNRFLMTKRLV